MKLAYLEALVLQDTLDRSIFSTRRQLGLKDNTKGTISDDFALRVLHFLCFACQSILDLFANDL